MQFTKLSITTVFAILATSAIAAPADSLHLRSPDAEAKEVYADEIASGMIKRGFGCPGDQTACHNHCASIAGYKGGYCDMLGLRCKCY